MSYKDTKKNWLFQQIFHIQRIKFIRAIHSYKISIFEIKIILFTGVDSSIILLGEYVDENENVWFWNYDNSNLIDDFKSLIAGHFAQVILQLLINRKLAGFFHLQNVIMIFFIDFLIQRVCLLRMISKFR